MAFRAALLQRLYLLAKTADLHESITLISHISPVFEYP